MRKIIAKARPSQYVFVDAYEHDVLRLPVYLYIDFCTVSELERWRIINPKIVAVSEANLHRFLLENDVKFLEGTFGAMVGE